MSKEVVTGSRFAEAAVGLPNWSELLDLPDAELGRIDLARKNLACAAGLPGAEGMDPDHCLRQIDAMTRLVGETTDHYYHGFLANPGKYRNSEGYFKAIVMVTVLQRDCGVRYNPAKIDADVPLDTPDAFLFGITQGEGGTCGTLPVLYTAVARRLGYPVFLVQAGEHVLCRWDDGRGERFNIEATNRGMSTHPDDYYRTGMYEKVGRFEEYGGFLKPLTPRRELANFLHQRAATWWQHNACRRACECIAWAAELDGTSLAFERLHGSLRVWRERMEQFAPPHPPLFRINLPGRRFKVIPEPLEADLAKLCVMEKVLTDSVYDERWWRPMRAHPHSPPADYPTELRVNVPAIPRYVD